ncbi:MAG TPA: hypothetical protein VFY17_06795 [Pilimelia sp.]|nr:hypothetical protein [Pilimelia sp.]
MRRVVGAAVAASGTWVDGDGVRQPGGEVHAWQPGGNATVCGVPLARAGLRRFPHARWAVRDSDQVGAADGVRHICRRCLAATRDRRDTGRGWVRRAPRP